MYLQSSMMQLWQHIAHIIPMNNNNNNRISVSLSVWAPKRSGYLALINKQCGINVNDGHLEKNWPIKYGGFTVPSEGNLQCMLPGNLVFPMSDKFSLVLTHLPLGHHWFRLFSSKRLTEPEIYCHLDPWEQTSLKFESIYKTFIHKNAFKNLWCCFGWKWFGEWS